MCINTKVENMTNCEKCGTNLTEKVNKYSVEKYKKPLCFKCQKEMAQQPTKNQQIDIKNFDPAFLGMCFNQAMENSRTYEKTYEEARDKLDIYFAEVLDNAVKLLKK